MYTEAAKVLVNGFFKDGLTFDEMDILDDKLYTLGISGVDAVLDELYDRNAYNGFTDTTPAVREGLLRVFQLSLEPHAREEHEEKIADMLLWDVFTEGWDDRTLISTAIEVISNIGGNYSIGRLKKLQEKICLIKYPEGSTFAELDHIAINDAIAKCKKHMPRLEDIIEELYANPVFLESVTSDKARAVMRDFEKSVDEASTLYDEDVAEIVLCALEKRRMEGSLSQNNCQTHCFLMLMDVLKKHAVPNKHFSKIEEMFKWDVWLEIGNSKLRNSLISLVKERGDNAMSYALESLGKELATKNFGMSETTSESVRNNIKKRVHEAVCKSRKRDTVR